jgi:hypothetical protein
MLGTTAEGARDFRSGAGKWGSKLRADHRGSKTLARGTKVGTFIQALMDEAKQKGLVVISMKNDWKTFFPSRQ